VTERSAGDSANDLRELQWHWGEVYLITAAAGHWIAHRRGNGPMLAATGPDELRELIIEDYAAQQQILRAADRRDNG
jgi:hypothetical protein